MTDDDKLDFDLSAWEAPPPPADLADAVIDRMGGTDVGLAVPVEEPPAPRRAWIIGGVAAAIVLVGLGVWSLVRSTEHAPPASGGVVAEQARSLSLATVHADLDAGADVRWRRDGNVLRVVQRVGRVAWHVDAGERLVIVAGSKTGSDAGAALASVEATGANLRVEVQMNAMDARVIGASAVTAAAVAMVTVVVYEGHVKVDRGGQTVVVAPGTMYQVTPDRPEPPVVGAAPVERANPVTVDSACDADALKDKGMQNINLGQHAAALADFEASLQCKQDPYVIQLAFMESCSSGNDDKAKLYYRQLSPAAQSKLAQICIRSKTAYTDDDSSIPDELDRAAIQSVMRQLGPAIDACAKAPTDGTRVTMRLTVAPKGTPEGGLIEELFTPWPATPGPVLTKCITDVILEKARFAATKKGGSFSYSFVFHGGHVIRDP